MENTSNATIKDAVSGFKKARERHQNFINENSSQIPDYEAFVNRIFKTDRYQIIGNSVRCPEGTHIAELYPLHKRIRITKKEPNLLGIISDHIKNTKNSESPKKENTPDSPEKITSKYKLQKEINREFMREWNGDISPLNPYPWQEKAYQLIEEYYENCPKQKPLLFLKNKKE